MRSETDPQAVQACFAPCERADEASLEAARRAFLANEIAVTLLEAIPDPAMVLNAQRQIVAVNGRLREALGVDSLSDVYGLRPGEALHCLHCTDAEGGCGTGPFCLNCGAVNAVVESFEERASVSRECRLQTRDATRGGALDLEVQATFVNVTGQDLIVVALRDISAEKRRQVLERVFFHDVLNTAAALNALAQFLDGGTMPAEIEHTWRQDLRRVSEQILEEIVSQRQLLAAEQGDLHASRSREPIRPLVESVLARYRPRHPDGLPTLLLDGAPEGAVVTDAVLLRRVLSNLVKNALEASAEGDTVTVRVREEGEAVVFEVHNPAVIPPGVQEQIFQRSFSTKGGRGRGVGTYSVRLFTERHLGGQASFESRAPEGTTFRIALPREGHGGG